jgi:hypothetical protein
MKFRLSERLNELAQPRTRSRIATNPKKDTTSLSNLVIYETSPRLLELAKPRRIQKLQPKEVYHIPRKVLRAQGSIKLHLGYSSW